MRRWRIAAFEALLARFLMVPSDGRGEATLFPAIRQLPPGHRMVIAEDLAVTVELYWTGTAVRVRRQHLLPTLGRGMLRHGHPPNHGELPVITSTATGAPDVGCNGHDLLLVSPADSRALVRALGRLAEDVGFRAALSANTGCGSPRVSPGRITAGGRSRCSAGSPVVDEPGAGVVNVSGASLRSGAS